MSRSMVARILQLTTWSKGEANHAVKKVIVETLVQRCIAERGAKLGEQYGCSNVVSAKMIENNVEVDGDATGA